MQNFRVNLQKERRHFWSLVPKSQLHAEFSYDLVIVIWLSLGKLLVNLLQMVKRTSTPLIPYHYGEGYLVQLFREILGDIEHRQVRPSTCCVKKIYNYALEYIQPDRAKCDDFFFSPPLR